MNLRKHPIAIRQKSCYSINESTSAHNPTSKQENSLCRVIEVLLAGLAGVGYTNSGLRGWRVVSTNKGTVEKSTLYRAFLFIRL